MSQPATWLPSMVPCSSCSILHCACHCSKSRHEFRVHVGEVAYGHVVLHDALKRLQPVALSQHHPARNGPHLGSCSAVVQLSAAWGR